MELKQLLINELEREAVNTRKMLKAVPEGRNDWKPHEKSFALGRLATHVAEIPHWLNRPLESDDYDMAAHALKSMVCESNAELLQLFEDKLASALQVLKNTSDDILMSEWTFRRGEHIIFKSTRYEAIRAWMYNHHIHHRGQLSVYLRLLDVPVPGTYGPSADDKIAMEQAQKN